MASLLDYLNSSATESSVFLPHLYFLCSVTVDYHHWTLEKLIRAFLLKKFLSLSRKSENKRHLVSTKANQFLLRAWIFPVLCQLDRWLFSRMTSCLLLWKGNVTCYSSKWRIFFFREFFPEELEPVIPVFHRSSHQPLQPPPTSLQGDLRGIQDGEKRKFSVLQILALDS